MLYHIPQVSGVAIPPAVVASLRARYGKVLAGVKDSSADFAQFRAFRAAAPDVPVVVGNEPDIARALAEGGTGTICGMANIVPGLVRALFTSAEAAKPMAEAVALMDGPFVSLLKGALAASTRNHAWSAVRPPLRAVEPARGAALASALAAIGTREAA
jgi:4-hydroxy-tetrahydrodipicolinate synthase